MISGIFQRTGGQQLRQESLSEFMSPVGVSSERRHVYTYGPLSASYRVSFRTDAYKQLKPAVSQDRGLAAVFTGRIYNNAELRRQAAAQRTEAGHDNDSWLTLGLYERFGLDFVKKLNGKFAFALWDKNLRRLVLGRDRMGIEPLYYYSDDQVLVFATSIAQILKCASVKKELNINALGKFLIFNYNPDLETFFKGIYRLPPGHLLIVDPRHTDIRRYWRLSFQHVNRAHENDIKEGLLSHLRDAVSCRIEADSQPGVFLSGGMDSSTVLMLTTEVVAGATKTFSYRCAEASFDESHYARSMANTTRTEHHEIEISGPDVLLIRDIVKEMNEPFCDAAINVATYVLGKATNGSVPYVLTGDGGDELFGGHPVYEANQIAHFVDSVPTLLKRPFISFFSTLPDSDKKKNMAVKLKRFSECLKYSEALLSHRWRVYYNPHELHQLLLPRFASQLNEHGLLEDILKINQEADGVDPLSRALYSDYRTVVDFYLRRNDLNRVFQLETRFPLLDHHLVEFCATIPSHMKIARWFDTKWILKKAMENILPRNIIYRRDKMGHSIPLKIWIRNNHFVRQFILDTLSEKRLKRRGIVSPSFVRRLIEEHMGKRCNHSHRIWALAVLELWLDQHLNEHFE